MQERHKDRKVYFNELAHTSEKYYLDYVLTFFEGLDKESLSDFSVLEIGCGEGGNLLPFAKLGAKVCGVDLAGNKIENARLFFENEQLVSGVKMDFNFISSDIFEIRTLENSFDLIMVHDVIEHIGDKVQFFLNCKDFLKSDGKIFFAFPPWQMPFGGHQQIARSRFVSKMPYIHLLPKFSYKLLLRIFGEATSRVEELLEIKSTGLSIETFIKISNACNYDILDARYFFINPHYEAKFGLKPRILQKTFASIPYLRNFFCTSSWFFLSLPAIDKDKKSWNFQ